MPKLIFVYELGNESFINGMFDFFHKLMDPTSYQCSNCEVTHNYNGMRNAWKSYLEWLPIKSGFYNVEMFHKEFPNVDAVVSPCVYILDSKTGLELVIASAELQGIGLSTLTSLINNQVVSCKLKPVIDKLDNTNSTLTH